MDNILLNSISIHMIRERIMDESFRLHKLREKLRVQDPYTKQLLSQVNSISAAIRSIENAIESLK